MPTLFDMVRIGSLQQGDIQVPLSRFCYAYLCGKIGELFPENFDRTILSVAHPARDFSGKERKRAWAGISPNISGDFTPFVFFNQVFLPSFRGEKDGNHEPDGDLLDRFIPEWKSSATSVRYFNTDKAEWAPGFFNANFYWWHYGDFKSIYSADLKQIIVSKLDVKQFSNFC